MCLRFRALLELAQCRALRQFALGDQHTDDAVLEVEPKASVRATPHRHRSCVLVTDTHVPLTRQPPRIWFWTRSRVGQANDLGGSAVAGQSEDALAELVLLAPAAPIEVIHQGEPPNEVEARFTAQEDAHPAAAVQLHLVHDLTELPTDLLYESEFERLGIVGASGLSSERLESDRGRDRAESGEAVAEGLEHPVDRAVVEP